MNLVTGATGNVGRQVVAELLSTAPIRALTRDPPAAHLPDGVDVARHALTEDRHRAKKYVVTGPAALTQVEQLPGRLPPELVDGILDAHAGFVTDPEPVTHTVADVTGRPACTFHQWAADHADDFR